MSFYDSVKIIVNADIIIIIGIIIWWFFKEQKINRLNKRLGNYAIESKNSSDNSLFDQILNLYHKLQNKVGKLFNKISFLKEYADRYNKYINKRKNPYTTGVDYIIAKVTCSFLILILVIISDILQNSSINITNIIMSLIVGYFIPDLFLIGKKLIVKKEMENDLLKAVTIMNNSFKSGMSIMQTIKIVSEEIDGPLQEEFKQMVLDLNYGLTIENVFARLEERVKLEDIKYISTSLSILNKTGGNIVKVFSSIEKTFFSNRKLAEELKNLTAASMFLYRILIFVPVAFILIIYILDSSYFNPLFTNIFGYIVIFVALFIYILYIIIVKKVLKIKED